MKRTLVIGDIHGGYKALKQVLEKASITEEDTLIFLGDYVDGWSESAPLIQFLIGLEESYNCIFIRGNHDVMCEQWLKNGNRDSIWLTHGGLQTIESYQKTGKIGNKQHITFFEYLKDYYIDEENRLYLHAGFSSMHGVQKEYFPSNFYWDRTLWETARILEELKDKEFHKTLLGPKRFKHYKEIYIGHTPTTNFNITTPMKAHNVWNIDTGAAFKGRVTILDVDTKEYWQSDTLPSLYPNEKGRN